MNSKQMAGMIWEYWFRIEIQNNAITIEDITKIIIKYYNIGRILKWRKKLGVKSGYKFIDEDKCVKRIPQGYEINGNGVSWILPNIEPVNKGIHCWRVKVDHTREESKGGWMVVGVSSPDPNMQDNTWAQKDVWGLAYNECWYPSSYKAISRGEPRNLYQKNLQVDILLNLEDETLNIGIVGQIDDEHEYKFKGIGKTNEFSGWVPHLNTYVDKYSEWCSAECELRIAEIPPEMYGQCDDIF